MAAASAYERVYDAHVVSETEPRRMQSVLTEVRSGALTVGKPMTFKHLTRDHVPKDNVTRVRVPDAAVQEVRQVFGSRYAVKKSEAGWTEMHALMPEDTRPYVVGWGKVILDISAAAVAPLEDVPGRVFPRQFAPPDVLLPPRKAPGKTVLDPPLVVVPDAEVPVVPDVRPPERIRNVADLMIFDDDVDLMSRTYFEGAPARKTGEKPMGMSPPLVPVPNRAAVNQLIQQAVPEGSNTETITKVLQAMETVYASTNSSMKTAWDLMENVFGADEGARSNAYALFSNMQHTVAQASRDVSTPKQDYKKHSAVLHAAFDASSLGLTRLAQRIAKESPDDAPTTPTILVRHDAIAMAETYFDRLTGDDDGFQLADDLLEMLVHAVRTGDMTVDEITSRNWKTYVDRERKNLRLMCDGMRDAGDIPDKDRAWLLTFLEHFERISDNFAEKRADALLNGPWTAERDRPSFGAPRARDDGSGDPPTSPVFRRKARMPRTRPPSGATTPTGQLEPLEPLEPLTPLNRLRRENSTERSNSLRREDAAEEDRIRLSILERLGAAPFLVRVLLIVWALSFTATHIISKSAMGPIASAIDSPEWKIMNASTAGARFFASDSDDAGAVMSQAEGFMRTLDDTNRKAGGAIWDDAGRVNLDAMQTFVTQELEAASSALNSRNREIETARASIVEGKESVLSSGASWTRRLADLAVNAQEFSQLKETLDSEGLPFPDIELSRLDAAQENAIIVEKMQQPGNAHMQALMDAAHTNLNTHAVREGEAGIETRLPARGWMDRLLGIAPIERALGTDSEPGVRQGLEIADVESELKSAAIEDGSYGADALQDAQRGSVARAVSANGDNLVAHTFGIGPGAGGHAWRNLPGTAYDGTFKTLVRNYNTIVDSVGYTVEQSTSLLRRMKRDNTALKDAVAAGTVDLEKFNAAQQKTAIIARLEQMRTIYRSDPGALEGLTNATVAEYRAAFRLFSRNNGMSSFDESTTRALMDSNNRMSALLTTLYDNILGPDSVAIRPVKDLATGISGLFDIAFTQLLGRADNREWGILLSYMFQTFQYWLIAHSALSFVGNLLTAVSFDLAIRKQSTRAVTSRAASNASAQAEKLTKTSILVRQFTWSSGADPGVNLPGTAVLAGMPAAVTPEEVQQRLSEGTAGIVNGIAILRSAQQLLGLFGACTLFSILPFQAMVAAGSVAGGVQYALLKKGYEVFVGDYVKKKINKTISRLAWNGIGSVWWSWNKRNAAATVQQMSSAYALGGHSVSALLLKTVAWRFVLTAAIGAVGAVADTAVTFFAQEPLARYLNQSVSIGDGGFDKVKPVLDAELRALQSMARSGVNSNEDFLELLDNSPIVLGQLNRAEDILEGDTQRLILQYTGSSLKIFENWLGSIAPSGDAKMLGAPAPASASASASATLSGVATKEEMEIFEDLFIRRTSGRSIGATISLLVAMSRRRTP